MIDDKLFIPIYIFLFTYLLRAVLDFFILKTKNNHYHSNHQNHKIEDVAILKTEIEYIKKEITEIKNELKRIR